MSDELNRNEFLKMLGQEVDEQSIGSMSQIWAKNYDEKAMTFSGDFSESVMDGLRVSNTPSKGWMHEVQKYFPRLAVGSMCLIAVLCLVLMIQENSFSIDAITGNTLVNHYEWSLMADWSYSN